MTVVGFIVGNYSGVFFFLTGLVNFVSKHV